jgi:hypothetical protein
MATVIFDAQRGSETFPLLSGTWNLSFSNSVFSTRGAVVANLNLEQTMLGITFDRNTVPCPEEPGGVAERTMFASMKVEGNHMEGSYVIGGCPGGTLALTRR